jgi:outer membrane immunogenic protein
MLRMALAAAAIAASLSFFGPAAQAARSLDDVLARLDALEKENESLRRRVQRLEAAERERPVVASLPTSAARSAAPAARSVIPAAAAIPPAAGQAYAAVPAPEVMRNWTGLYIGASAGLRREDHKWTTNAFLVPAFGSAPNNEDFSDTGARVGGFAGFNMHVTPKIVIGIEGDIAWGSTETSTKYIIPGTGIGNFPIFGGLAPNDSSQFKTEWDASLRGRLGALITPDTLAYLTGGAAWQHIKATATCDASVPLPNACLFTSASETQSKTLTGWTLGAGVETTLGQYWTGRIEYRYADFSNFNHLFLPLPFGDGNLDTTIKLATHTFTAGLAFKFGGY